MVVKYLRGGAGKKDVFPSPRSYLRGIYCPFYLLYKLLWVPFSIRVLIPWPHITVLLKVCHATLPFLTSLFLLCNTITEAIWDPLFLKRWGKGNSKVGLLQFAWSTGVLFDHFCPSFIHSFFFLCFFKFFFHPFFRAKLHFSKWISYHVTFLIKTFPWLPVTLRTRSTFIYCHIAISHPLKLTAAFLPTLFKVNHHMVWFISAFVCFLVETYHSKLFCFHFLSV